MNKKILLNPTFKKRLLHALGLTITLKIIAVFILFFMFFSPAHRPNINPKALEQHLLTE